MLEKRIFINSSHNKSVRNTGAYSVKCNSCIQILSPGTQTLTILKQIGHVEFWNLALGDLFLWASALSQDTAGGRGQTCGERVPDGGT